MRRRGALVLVVATAALLAPAGPALAGTLLIGAQAGTGVAGTPAAGPALSSPLGSPQGTALDAAGDLYVADAAADEVLEITPAGTLSILAGTGTAGAPTPGPAGASRLNGPTGVAVDSAGDVYIADTGNHEVETVTTGGTLSIVAGTGTAGAPVAGTATGSPLGGPAGLALDAVGDLYIADGGGDGGNPYVEKVTPAGALSIIAGDGTRALPSAGPATGSPLEDPTGVAVDASGDVFIADPASNLVVKVTPAGTLSLFAGKSNGAAGAPAAGSATRSHLDAPTGLATDSAGDLYIADAANERIEEVTPADRLSVLAGDGVAAAPTYGGVATASALDDPTAVAVTPAGVVLIADTAHASIDRLAPAAPADIGVPAIGGTAIQGDTLTATSGSWTNSPATYAYQWQDCDTAGDNCTAIPGATAAGHLLTTTDIGHTLRVVVTAGNAGGSASHSSDPSATVVPQPPANLSAPAISGTTTDAGTLTAAPGTWTESPTGYTDQWEDCDATGANCATIGGATAVTYAVQSSDLGDTLRVIVTAANAGGSTETTSAATAAITAALIPWANTTPPTVVGLPVVTGTGAVGDTLTCSTGRWNGGPAAYSYQWSSSDAPIAGATGVTYTVGRGEVNQTLTCAVTATNAGGAIQAESTGVPITGGATGQGCPPPTGSMSGPDLGPVALGNTRAQARRRLPRYTATSGREDTFCLAGGQGIRVGYASPSLTALVAGVQRSQISGRIVLALTANPYYGLYGVTAGLHLSAVRTRLHLGTAVRIGATRWYLMRHGAVNAVLGIRQNVVVAVGLANRRLSATTASLHRLLATFPR